MWSFLNTHTYFPSSGVQQDSEIFSRCDLSWSSGGTTGGTSSRIIMHEDTPARCEFNSNSLYAFFYHIRVCVATKLVHVFCHQKKMKPNIYWIPNVLSVKPLRCKIFTWRMLQYIQLIFQLFTNTFPALWYWLMVTWHASKQIKYLIFLVIVSQSTLHLHWYFKNPIVIKIKMITIIIIVLTIIINSSNSNIITTLITKLSQNILVANYNLAVKQKYFFANYFTLQVTILICLKFFTFKSLNLQALNISNP